MKDETAKVPPWKPPEAVDVLPDPSLKPHVDSDDSIDIKDYAWPDDIAEKQPVVENAESTAAAVSNEHGAADWEQGTSKGCTKKVVGDGKPKPKRPKGMKVEGMPGEPTLYQCDYCPKVYPSIGGIKYHRLIFHSAEYKPPVCNICGKAFRLQKYLDTHKNTVHLKLKDHLCDMCGKAFSSKFGLKLHKMVHAGEKNFPCEVCGMRFNTVGKVNTHKLVHGGPKLYVCEVCSRAFRWKKSLLTHMRTHSGERPFKCEHCDRSFSVQWNMQQHVRIHTGERPYVCDLCGKSFVLNAAMKEHRSKHHPTIALS